nr:PREDICTED: uncharacterized protein LOC105661765 [Megachile rotundata]
MYEINVGRVISKTGLSLRVHDNRNRPCEGQGRNSFAIIRDASVGIAKRESANTRNRKKTETRNSLNGEKRKCLFRDKPRAIIRSKRFVKLTLENPGFVKSTYTLKNTVNIVGLFERDL